MSPRRDKYATAKLLRASPDLSIMRQMQGHAIKFAVIFLFIALVGSSREPCPFWRPEVYAYGHCSGQLKDSPHEAPVFDLNITVANLITTDATTKEYGGVQNFNQLRLTHNRLTRQNSDGSVSVFGMSQKFSTKYSVYFVPNISARAIACEDKWAICTDGNLYFGASSNFWFCTSGHVGEYRYYRLYVEPYERYEPLRAPRKYCQKTTLRVVSTQGKKLHLPFASQPVRPWWKPAPSSASSNSHTLSKGAIAGATVGAVFALSLCCLKQRNRSKSGGTARNAGQANARWPVQNPPMRSSRTADRPSHEPGLRYMEPTFTHYASGRPRNRGEPADGLPSYASVWEDAPPPPAYTRETSDESGNMRETTDESGSGAVC